MAEKHARGAIIQRTHWALQVHGVHKSWLRGAACDM